jgi:oligoribonuclease NrnB/cAMP/cGMP phosphodiesterase (DHH superfamily)
VKPLVIYHAGCMDGAGAALAAWMKFGEEAEYRPANYGQAAPTDEEVRGRDVYIVDFSYPRVELERMRFAQSDWDCRTREPGNLLVLDHHKTAEKDLSELRFCVFDMRKSGAVMAWEYFHCSGLADPPQDEGRVPDLLRYIQDRDLWRWEMANSREISAALAATGAAVDFRKLEPFLDWDGRGDGSRTLRRALEQDGRAILRAESQMIERIAVGAESVTVGGWSALAVSSPVLQSEVGEALAIENAKRGRPAIGVSYFRDGKSGKWIVSLRSRDLRDEHGPEAAPAPDVSAIARSFGGGGHAKAAGFQCDTLPW